MTEAPGDDTGAAMDEADLAEASELALAINAQIQGRRADILLQALSIIAANVLRITVGDGGTDRTSEIGAFAGVAVNIHAGLSEPPRADVMMVGEDAGLSPAQARAAVALCPLLNDLMAGLLLHYPAKEVLNAWFSAFLSIMLIDGGVEETQRVLVATAEALPATHEKMEALRAMDDGATHQGGRA